MDRRVAMDGEPMWASTVRRRVTVRPARREAEGQCKSLIPQRHDLGPHRLVGERPMHVAEVDGHGVAVLGGCSAALKVSARDQRIGWNPQQKQRRRK
jgi:hypothetical protein